MNKIIAIMGGGDWADASVAHLVIPDGMNLDKEHDAYREWYQNKYLPALRRSRDVVHLKVKYITFANWLIKHGARQTTEEEVLEFWE